MLIIKQQFNQFDHHKALLTLKLCTLRKRESKYQTISKQREKPYTSYHKYFPQSAMQIMWDQEDHLPGPQTGPPTYRRPRTGYTRWL